MCTFDRGVSRAKLGADVEGGRAAAADDDVVCVDVVFAPIALVAGGTFTWSSSVFSRLARDRISARGLDLYVFSPLTTRQTAQFV
jgi:hypothetical protein